MSELSSARQAGRATRPVRDPSAPRTAVIWAALRAELHAQGATADRPARILDAGGGSGQFAVPLAALGHAVTVVDASPDALAALERRAAEHGVADRVRAVQGDADSVLDVVAPASQDLILCHSVLEVVDDPAAALAPVAAALRPGGAVSLLVANRNAAVLAKAISGHFAAAGRILADPDGRSGDDDRLLRRFDVAGATRLLDGAGLAVEAVHGVRVVADLVPPTLQDGDPGTHDALLTLELAAADRSPLRDIATALHLLARRPGSPAGPR